MNLFEHLTFGKKKIVSQMQSGMNEFEWFSNRQKLESWWLPITSLNRDSMLRVRPVSQKETKANDDSIIQFPGEGQIWVRMITRSIIVFVKRWLSDTYHGFDQTMRTRSIIVLIKQWLSHIYHCFHQTTSKGGRSQRKLETVHLQRRFWTGGDPSGRAGAQWHEEVFTLNLLV